MTVFLTELRKKIPTWLGGTRLSRNDQAQAQIMGMALAGLKAAEINAMALQRQSDLLRKLIAEGEVSKNYALAAAQAADMLKVYDTGSIEHEAMYLMSAELFNVAGRLNPSAVDSANGLR
jgi:hypothetical protein